MSQEVFEIVLRMNLRNIEAQLACQCAPVITGLKASNLLITSSSNVKVLHRILKDSDISYFILFSGEDETVILLLNRYQLELFLKEKNVVRLLRCFGYPGTGIGRQLFRLKKRYTEYRSGKSGFPHEMGLFLAYPMEDVIGFIENDGQNSQYSGYWKVYGNMDEKLKIFKEFDRAKESLMRAIARGISIPKILEYYQYKVIRG